MKSKNVRRLLCLLVVLATFLGLSVTAYATEASVTFTADKIIVFEPGSAYTDTDLFDDFKGLMPGDSKEETITIQNESDFDYVKVYMRAVSHDEANALSENVASETTLDAMNDFLSQLSMTVYNGTEVIYSASPAETDGLTEAVYLGTLAKGETLSLNAVLNVPITLDNGYMNAIGEVDWEFIFEGYNEETLIQTGQLNWPIYVLSGMGLLCLGLGLFFMKRRKDENA